jgi:hypothetical protein
MVFDKKNAQQIVADGRARCKISKKTRLTFRKNYGKIIGTSKPTILCFHKNQKKGKSIDK